MKAGESFFTLYSHDLIRVAVATPEVRVADPAFNGRQTIEGMRLAARQQAILALFPELGLSAYSCKDLFQQRAVLDGCLDALREVVAASVPNAPKVGSGGSLSPRGDYRAPSDAASTAWLHALDLVPDSE